MQYDKPVTITVFPHHGFIAGDTIVIKRMEDRWWIRLWYYITFRKTPTRTVTATIGNVTATTFEIDA